MTRYPTTFTIRDAAAREIPPMFRDWLVKNAECVNESRRSHASLWVTDGSIDAVAGDFETRAAEMAPLPVAGCGRPA